MIIKRHRLYYRACSLLTLLLCAPMFFGLAPIWETCVWAQSPDAENGAYELTGNAALHQLAESLNFRALDIFEWVRREVRYEAYPGAVKGAIGTFYARSGNAIDKAELLGELLNEANATWRFAVGTARIAPSVAYGWLGVSTAAQAGAALDAAGCDYRWLGDPNAPEALILRNHVWIEVNGPFLPLRGGSADDVTTGTAKPGPAPVRETMWTALDPTITQRAAPAAEKIQERLGTDSEAAWTALDAETTPVDSGKGVQGIPSAQIRAQAVAAAKTLRDQLKRENQSLDAWLAAPAAPALPERTLLPGNLPYEVAGSVATFDPGKSDELIGFLRGQRRMIALRVGTANGGYTTPWVSVGLPRLAQSALAIQFAPLTTADADDLAASVNAGQAAAGTANLKARVTLGGYDLLPDQRVGVGLGAAMQAEIREANGTIARVPIVAGGYYVLTASGGINADAAAAWRDRLFGLYTVAQQGEGSALQGTTHDAILSAWLEVAGQTMLAQSEQFERAGLAALDHQAFGQRRLLAGIEPSFDGTQLTTPTLVAHLVDPRPAVAARVAGPAIGEAGAGPLGGLIADAGLTAAMERLAGSDAYQSATRLMSINNDQNLVSRSLPRNTTNPQGELTGRIPSGSALLTEMSDRLRASNLALADPSLSGAAAVGRSNAPAGWAFIESNANSAQGDVLLPDGRRATASAPLAGSLYPLDSVQDAGKGRYMTLLAQGYAWSQAAVKATDALSAAPVAAAALASAWIDPAKHGASPAAIPAVAIALHGALDALGVPEIDAVEVSPSIFNSVAVGDNPAKTLLTASASVNSLSDEADFAFTNAAGDEDFALAPVDAPTTPSANGDRTTYTATVDLSTTTTLSEGTHTVTAWAALNTGVQSERKSTEYIVDNHAPRLDLSASTTGTITGRFALSGLADDPHLASYRLLWKHDGAGQWEDPPLAQGTQPIPLKTMLGSFDSQKRGWNGAIDFGLEATDAAGNSATSTTQAVFNNDYSAPDISLIHTGGSELAGGETLSGAVDLTLSADDPTAPSASFGIVSLKMTVAREGEATTNTRILIDDAYTSPLASSVSRPYTLDTFALPHEHLRDRYTIAIEARDAAGNVVAKQIKHLAIGNEPYYFDAEPSFRPGASGADGVGWIAANFASQSTQWELSILESDDAQLKSWSGSGNFVKNWDGASGAGYVAPGVYRARLYLPATDVSADRTIAVLPSLEQFSAIGFDSWITQLSVRDPIDNLTSTTLNISPSGSGLEGAKILLTGKYSELNIHAHLGDPIKTFLDGKGPNPPNWNPPYKDAYWALEFKSSLAFPKASDIHGAHEDGNAADLTDRSSWFPIAWGNDYPTGGDIVAKLDTSPLPEGYYDVRLWVTDGQDCAHHVLEYLKVIKGEDMPVTGNPGSVGAMTLTATDMTVPFTGYNAAITRSYNSNNIYAPSPIGYGWQFGGIALDIQPYDQASGEYDEATIRLPDGRQFFFANNPYEGSSLTDAMYNSWARFGLYTTRPYGMKLYRPGGSREFHWPNGESAQWVLQGNDTGLNLGPGATGRDITVNYQPLDKNGAPHGAAYGPGEVAYLQTEDKTWYIFVWQTGDLLEIIKPDGQRTTFDHPDAANIDIYDAAGRVVKVERETGSAGGVDADGFPTAGPGVQRIRALTDPLGNQVTYDYDQYGNLATVTDRSGRKRFYIYDTPETKKDPQFADRKELTGAAVHYLVDVRVDDDSNGAPRFAGDTLPDGADARLAGNDPAHQEWPGDVSILKVSYEGGLLKGIETAAGGVAMQHQMDAKGGGTETVEDSTTGAASKVVYDDQQRVTQVKDAWGNVSTNTYATQNNISGVLTQQTDALGHDTHFEYTAPAQKYSSFAAQFSAYLDSKLQSDLDQPGYLTGAQAQPSKIVQYHNGSPVETNIAYQIDDPSRSDAFQPTSVVDPLGNQTALAYDPTLGSLTTVDFTASGGTHGAKVENLYVASGAFKGRLLKTYSRAADGATSRSTSYSYEKRFDGGGMFIGERQTVTDNTTGLATVSEIDASGHLTKSTDARGRVSISNYDGEGRLIYSIDPEGNETWHNYDVFGREVSSRDHPAALAGEANVNFITRMEYDDAGRVSRTTRRAYLGDEDFSGPGRLLGDSRTEYESDETGRSTTSIDRFGRKSISINDAGGRLARSEQYDAQGRLVDWTAYEYDALGRTVSTTTRRGVTSTSVYDDLGRATSSTVSGGGESHTTSYTYDNGGRQVTSTVAGSAGNLVTTNHYDNLGRISYVDLNGTTIQTNTYDPAEGRLVTRTDAEGKATHWGYDERGRQTDWWFDWDGSTTSHMHFRFKFDGFGNQTAFEDGNGTTRTKVYDDLGRLAREYSPALTATNGALAAGDRMVKEYQYDGRGRVRAIVEGKVHAPDPEDATLTAAISDARTATTTFDPVTGAATQIAYSDGRTEKHFYDPDDGSLVRVEIWKAGILTWWRTIAYDEERRTATVATPEGTVGYQYNEYGELTELKTSWGQTTDYQYDCFGRMTAVASNKLGTSGGTVRYAYDPATGRKSDVTRPNGVTTHYTYDALGNVYIIDHFNATTHLLTLTYTRDNRGIITALEEERNGAADVNWSYTYDGAKRLTGADRDNGSATETWGYTYDDAGNRTVKSHDDGTPTTVNYAYNEIGQMLSDGTTTYRYDTYGNLQYEIRASDGDYLRQYVWDGENHLLAVKLWTAGVASTATAPDRTVAMSYDDQGGRVGRKQTAGATVEADNRYLTDYGNPTGYSQVLEQLDSSATSAEKDFIYGADLLAQADSGGDLGYLLGDHLGSTRLLTDGGGGAITDTAFDYSPYGEPLGTSGSSLTTYPHAFTGQWRDESLGLQFHRARWLNCAATSWLSFDSAFDFPGNLGNSYAYAGLDPISTFDPSGNNLLLEVLGVIGIVMSLVSLAIHSFQFYKHPSWSGAGWIAFDILTLIPFAWILKWARRGVQVTAPFFRAQTAAEFIAQFRNLPNVTQGTNFEAWVSMRLLKGAIPGLEKMATVDTTIVEGKSIIAVGNDMMAVGTNGAPKVIEVTSAAAKDFAKTDVLEYKGIAQRLVNLIDRNHEAIPELLNMGLDPRFANRGMLKLIAEGGPVPAWFAAIERIAIVPEGSTAFVPEGVKLVFVP